MIIKTYIVSDMKEALVRAKYELGKDAIIVSQRKIKVGQWFNPFKTKKIEVTLAIEEDKVGNPLTPVMEEASEDLKTSKHDFFHFTSDKMKEQLADYSHEKGKKEFLFSLEEKREFLATTLTDNCFEKKCKLARINVMVGPTGVGKTTTIAKIAAKEYLMNKKKVGVITLDTYRIGAVEQIKTYASILGLPCEVVNEPSEMESKINKLSYCDLILIDTLGTSQNNNEKLNEIASYLENIQDSVHTYLVCSVSTDWATLESILDKYKRLDYNALILTKFDEVCNYSNIWNIIENVSYPVQYICNGQNVPEDICEATVDNVIVYCEEKYHD